MRRFFGALIFGFIFPITYTVIMGAMSSLFPTVFPDTTVMFGQDVPGFAFAPTMFPSYFLFWLSANANFGWSSLIDSVMFRVTFLALPNFLLYSFIGYLLLGVLGFPFNKKEDGISSHPPPPQDFVA